MFYDRWIYFSKGFTNFYINRKFFTGGNGPVESIFDQTTLPNTPAQRESSDRSRFYASKKTVIGALFSGIFYKGVRDVSPTPYY